MAADVNHLLQSKTSLPSSSAQRPCQPHLCAAGLSPGRHPLNHLADPDPAPRPSRTRATRPRRSRSIAKAGSSSSDTPLPAPIGFLSPTPYLLPAPRGFASPLPLPLPARRGFSPLPPCTARLPSYPPTNTPRVPGRRAGQASDAPCACGPQPFRSTRSTGRWPAGFASSCPP